MPESQPTFTQQVASFFATPAGRYVYRFLVFVVWPSIVAGLGLPVEADVKTRELLDMPAVCEVCPACPAPSAPPAPASSELVPLEPAPPAGEPATSDGT